MKAEVVNVQWRWPIARMIYAFFDTVHECDESYALRDTPGVRAMHADPLILLSASAHASAAEPTIPVCYVCYMKQQQKTLIEDTRP